MMKRIECSYDECIREVCEEMKKAAATAGKQAQNEAEE
jgi:hypothetical protein